MATYLYVCKTCGESFSSSTRDLESHCTEGDARRDYRGEAVGFATASLRKENDFSVRAPQFLPMAKDFESPSDPDGQKGLRAWRDSVHPAEGNKRPYNVDLKRRSL